MDSRKFLQGVGLAVALSLAACEMEDDEGRPAKDPATAPRVSVDRFSEAAGTLMVRDATNGLPAANAPVDFDQGPFITRGLGPDGQKVRYYNFDVMPLAPAPIWVIFRAGESAPVAGQLNIIDVLPGEAGYNDFWRPFKVTVPADYRANQLTSRAEIVEDGYPVEPLDVLVNCPVVPEGSTAMLRGTDEDKGLIRGWYKGMVVHYFTFGEAPLKPTASGQVPVSPIYVTFNVNPDQEGGGPPSGFVTEDGTDQTHNVVETIPADAAYSPLWFVNVYDNAEFDQVSDRDTAAAATRLASGVANVNCPVIGVM